MTVTVSTTHREREQRDREREKHNTREKHNSANRPAIEFCANHLIGPGCRGNCRFSHALPDDLAEYASSPTVNSVCKFGRECRHSKYSILCPYKHTRTSYDDARIIEVLAKKQDRIDALRRRNDDAGLELHNTKNQLRSAQQRIEELELQQQSYLQQCERLAALASATIVERQREENERRAMIEQHRSNEQARQEQLDDLRERNKLLNALVHLHQRRPSGENI